MKEAEEVWRPYPKHKDITVSTYGRIRHSLTSRDIKLKHFGKYYRLYYDILDANVHHIVAETFIPNPEDRKYLRHKNSNTHDNRVSNLEWTTRSTGGRKKSQISDTSTESMSTRTNESDTITVENYSIVYIPIPCKWAVFFEDELIGVFESREEAINHC